MLLAPDGLYTITLVLADLALSTGRQKDRLCWNRTDSSPVELLALIEWGQHISILSSARSPQMMAALFYRRGLPFASLLLSLLPLAHALSLASFQAVQSTNAQCINSYNEAIPECSEADFSKDTPCSLSCISSLKRTGDAVAAACQGGSRAEGTLLESVVSGKMVQALCPNVQVTVEIITPSSTSSAPETMTAPRLPTGLTSILTESSASPRPRKESSADVQSMRQTAASSQQSNFTLTRPSPTDLKSHTTPTAATPTRLFEISSTLKSSTTTTAATSTSTIPTSLATSILPSITIVSLSLTESESESQSSQTATTFSSESEPGELGELVTDAGPRPTAGQAGFRSAPLLQGTSTLMRSSSGAAASISGAGASSSTNPAAAAAVTTARSNRGGGGGSPFDVVGGSAASAGSTYRTRAVYLVGALFWSLLWTIHYW